LGVIFMGLGIAEVHQESIPQELGNMSVKTLDDFRTSSLIGTDHLTVLFGVELRGQFGGIDQVAEHDRELTAFCLRGVLDVGCRATLGKMGFLDIRKRRTRGRRDRCWDAGATRPDQHGVVLIHGELEDLDNFGCEILEVGVVELKLALEGTIRHTAPALEHGDRLVEDLLKGHSPPSLCRWGVQKTV
jgi:hypothetical protein